MAGSFVAEACDTLPLLKPAQRRRDERSLISTSTTGALPRSGSFIGPSCDIRITALSGASNGEQLFARHASDLRISSKKAAARWIEHQPEIARPQNVKFRLRCGLQMQC